MHNIHLLSAESVGRAHRRRRVPTRRKRLRTEADRRRRGHTSRSGDVIMQPVLRSSSRNNYDNERKQPFKVPTPVKVEAGLRSKGTPVMLITKVNRAHPSLPLIMSNQPLRTRFFNDRTRSNITPRPVRRDKNHFSMRRRRCLSTDKCMRYSVLKIEIARRRLSTGYFTESALNIYIKMHILYFFMSCILIGYINS